MRAIRGDTTTELVTNKHLTALNAAEACVRENGKDKGTNIGQEGMMGGMIVCSPSLEVNLLAERVESPLPLSCLASV